MLKFLLAEHAISEELARGMLGWHHSGFSVHNQVRVAAEDAEGRKKLARYMLRAPLSLEKLTYEPRSDSVLYRSKMHLGLKRNFQAMGGAEWLGLLCKHIPERYEHLVRYCGWYANRCRGERSKRTALSVVAAAVEDLSEHAKRAKAAWARLIRKGYEVDPLQCPRCKGPMRVIALIDEAAVIRRILTHQELWAPELPRGTERAPPPGIESPAHAPVPLTCHRFPDIA